MAVGRPVTTGVIRRGTIAVPLPLKREFQRLCFDEEVQQSAVIMKLMRDWIDKKKKKRLAAAVKSSETAAPCPIN